MLKVENGYLLLPEYGKYHKKVTGTSFSALAGVNRFKPRGDALLSMWGFVKESIDPFYTDRGAIAEKIVYAKLAAEGMELKTWNKEEVFWDNFPSNPNLGGLIDIAVTAPERTLYECKSKNVSATDKVKKWMDEDHRHQAMFYGYLSKCSLVHLIYVLFTDEQEEAIRSGFLTEKSTVSPEDFKFIEKPLEVSRIYMDKKVAEALAYREKCIAEKRIPLTDVSEKYKQLLGL